LTSHINKDGTIDQTNEIRYEDWQSKYRAILEEYKEERQRSLDMMNEMHENQVRYIRREQEYNEVVNNIQAKIYDNSTRPLELAEEKTAEQYLLEGIDLNDKAQSKEILKQQEVQKNNAKYLEGNANKEIKNINVALRELNGQIDRAQEDLGRTLKKERDKILEVLQNKIDDINETFKKKEAERRDNMYDIKQKEKELTEALEIFTKVA